MPEPIALQKTETGASYATPECAPFFKDTGGSECCLCIHGFTGCPAIYLPLADELEKLGYSVSAPLLTGHGTRPDELRGVRERSWFYGVAAELERLLARYRTVHIIGLSLGGAIATWLAGTNAARVGLGRLILLAPGFGLKDKRYYEADFFEAEDVMIQLPRRKPAGDGLDHTRFGYPAMPLYSIKQLLMAAERSTLALDIVRMPTMLLYTAADMIADPDACQKAAERIVSIEINHRYATGEHNLLLGPDRLDVIRRIVEFLGPAGAP
jgi:carboxylesterase